MYNPDSWKETKFGKWVIKNGQVFSFEKMEDMIEDGHQKGKDPWHICEMDKYVYFRDDKNNVHYRVTVDKANKKYIEFRSNK